MSDSNRMEDNRRFWEETVKIHSESEFYDLEGFKNGKSSLLSVETEELGDVSGKSLLHLQCHFGMDTLSWARRGAVVTGVDYSENAVSFARKLSEELGMEARFVHSDVYGLPEALEGKFDVVYTSYGVLCWLDDLTKWAGVIGHFLKDGGVFYIVENHPFFVDVFDEENGKLFPKYPYFGSDEPAMFESDGTYADGSAHMKNTKTYEWAHPISEVINALIGAGMRIEFFHEFPFIEFQHNPLLERGDDGYWRMGERSPKLPMMYSIKATKEG